MFFFIEPAACSMPDTARGGGCGMLYARGKWDEVTVEGPTAPLKFLVLDVGGEGDDER